MSNCQYADVEIRITRREKEDTVEFTVNHEREFGPGSLGLDLSGFNGLTPEEQGEHLYRWLFADEQVRQHWAEICASYPQRRIRLRIDSDAPELHALPWELLREVRSGHTTVEWAASRNTPFSRYVGGSWQPGTPIYRRPLKILVVIPCPDDLLQHGLPPFDVSAEWQIIEEALKSLDIELVQLPAPCTLNALQAELRKGYHVLHLITHGLFESKQSVIVMADADNNCVFVTENEFAEMLVRSSSVAADTPSERLQLIYLDSCETAMRDMRDAFRGFAPALVKAGIPAVLAMQERIEVRVAQAFAKAFYENLLIHGLVDVACNQARDALINARLPGGAIPVLFMRLHEGTLLGLPGQITGGANFWPFLVKNIKLQKCVPIIGPGILAGLLPSQSYIAEQLAAEYGYPMSDKNNLARVTQYIQTQDPDLLIDSYNNICRQYLLRTLYQTGEQEQKAALEDLSFGEVAEHLQWSNYVKNSYANEIHHLLAELELPLYLTTNFDNFLLQALKSDGNRQPRQLTIRWDLGATTGAPIFALEPPPSRQSPVILHLNGFQDVEDPNCRMVFSEDDYLNQFARITQQRDNIFPANVLGMLAQSRFLLIGFDLQDWDFRLIVQGLLPAIAQTTNSKKSHVGIQLHQAETADNIKVVEFITKFLGQFQIDVYWGTPQQFVNELRNYWRKRP